MEPSAAFAARAVEVVRAVAAEEILPRYRSVEPRIKDDGTLVTAADFAAQDALVRRLRLLEPIAIVAEEMPSHEQVAAYESSPRFWCIDPLDGTKNFSEGVPFFAISVALVDRGLPVFGVVYDPIADEAFHAVRGKGAWLNGEALCVPGTGPVLADAIVDVSLYRDPHLRTALKKRKPYARRVTRGSSALSWCHLAAARTDGLLHSGQKLWDYAAGSLVLAEAGGQLATLEHEDFWSAALWRRSVLAARTPGLLAEMHAWVARESAQ